MMALTGTLMMSQLYVVVLPHVFARGESNKNSETADYV
jgi:hypothetical protein